MLYVYFKTYFMYSEHKNDKIETNHHMPFIVIMTIKFYYNIFSYLIGTLDVRNLFLLIRHHFFQVH